MSAISSVMLPSAFDLREIARSVAAAGWQCGACRAKRRAISSAAFVVDF